MAKSVKAQVMSPQAARHYKLAAKDFQSRGHNHWRAKNCRETLSVISISDQLTGTGTPCQACGYSTSRPD
jgi:hypothetical protein